MKTNKYFKGGFTLIEVLISLVILSIVTLITSNFLKSSIESKDFVSRKSQDTYKFNLLSNTLDQDLIHAVNVPMTDFRGGLKYATFIVVSNSSSFTFTTKTLTKDLNLKSLVRVQYLLQDESFLRRQYYAASPSNTNEYLETELFKNIKDFKLEFADKNRWYFIWPIGPITQRQIPHLVKVSIINNQNEKFIWVIKPSIDTVYE